METIRRYAPARRSVLLWLALPLGIEILAWQPLPLVPLPGLDSSWGAGLEMAVHNGLDFGHQIVFTYGPLGFLQLPYEQSAEWYSHLGELAFLYIAAVRFALVVVLLATTRRTFGPWVGAGLTFFAACFATQLPEAVIMLALLLWLVLDEPPARRRDIACGGLGAFTALELLGKTSVGLMVGLMLLVALLALPRRRPAALVAAAAGFLVALVALWLAVGEDISSLFAFLVRSVQIASGYGAMAFDVPAYGWVYLAAYLALATGAWGIWQSTALAPPRARRGLLLVWLVFWWLAFKEGFVRFSSLHLVIFLLPMVGVWLVLRWRSSARPAAVLAAATFAAFALAVGGVPFTSVVDPTNRPSVFVDNLRTVAGVHRRGAALTAGRDSIIVTEPLTTAVRAAVGDHTVAVYPWEMAVVWAYGLNWRPLPVFQSYTAYTPPLDGIDARFLRSSSAPERILLQATGGLSIDGRVLAWDEPETARELVCRYRPGVVSRDWTVLVRGPTRCGTPTPLETVQAAWGQQVPVPAPAGQLVFARIDGAGDGAIGSLVATAYRPEARYVLVNDGPARRLVVANLDDGVQLRVPPALRYPGKFALSAQAGEIAFYAGPGTAPAGRPLTIHFFTVPVS